MANTEGTEQYQKISVTQLKGLNERNERTNPELGEFDILKGCIPNNAGTLTRINGIKKLLDFGTPIWGIFQTNNSTQSTIVQTPNALYTLTEAQLFSQTPYVPNLTYTALADEESMAYAILIDQYAAGTDAGTMANNTNWQQATLTSIPEQFNADGTAASFVSLAANQFTLAAGKYRIEGWSKFTVAATSTKVRARLYDVTNAAAAWAGQANENSDEGSAAVISQNTRAFFGGYLTVAAPTTYELEHKAATGTASTTFGKKANDGFAFEIYRWVRILQTA